MNSIYDFSEDSEIQKGPLSFTPYEKFMFVLSSNESKRHHPKRLQVVLDFLNIRSKSIEENCRIP